MRHFQYWTFIKNVLNGFAGSANALSIGGVTNLFYKEITYCSIESIDCNQSIDTNTAYVSLASAYFNFFITSAQTGPMLRFFGATHSFYVRGVYNAWSNITDFTALYGFLLQLFHEELEIPNFNRQAALVGAIVLMSNVNFREKIKKWCYGNTDRREFMSQVSDACFEFLRGFCISNGLLTTLLPFTPIENFSSTGRWTRHSVGIVWGSACAYAGYYTLPTYCMDNLFNPRPESPAIARIIPLLNGIQASIIFSCIASLNIEKSTSPHTYIQISLFSLLMIFIMVRSCLIGDDYIDLPNGSDDRADDNSDDDHHDISISSTPNEEENSNILNSEITIRADLQAENESALNLSSGDIFTESQVGKKISQRDDSTVIARVKFKRSALQQYSLMSRNLGSDKKNGRDSDNFMRHIRSR